MNPPPVHLREAHANETEQVVRLLTAMQAELGEIELQPEVVQASVSRSFSEGVHWFLFVDAQQEVFGCCHLQSVHKYWSLKRRYYLGGFYIQPTHRKKGYFRALNDQLQAWATANDGTSIYAHIHEANNKSLSAFSSVGLEACEYKLCHKGWDI
jgi:L-amino acid N-acyltransferase YncA